MRTMRARSTIGCLAVAVTLSGCHMKRPGEYYPARILGCEPEQITAMESRYAQLTASEREQLTYCREAQRAEAARASQEHLDYIADLQFFGIVLSVVFGVLAAIVEGT